MAIGNTEIWRIRSEIFANITQGIAALIAAIAAMIGAFAIEGATAAFVQGRGSSATTASKPGTAHLLAAQARLCRRRRWRKLPSGTTMWAEGLPLRRQSILAG